MTDEQYKNLKGEHGLTQILIIVVLVFGIMSNCGRVMRDDRIEGGLRNCSENIKK